MKNLAGYTLFTVTGEETCWVCADAPEEALNLYLEMIGDDEDEEPLVKELEADAEYLDKQLGGDAESGQTLRKEFLTSTSKGILASTIY